MSHSDPLGTGFYVAFVIALVITAFVGGYIAGWSDATNPTAKVARERGRAQETT